MKSRRFFTSTLFGLALLLAQQLGLVHALSHLAHERSSEVSRQKSTAVELQCSQCMAFAALGAALPGSTAPAAVVVLPDLISDQLLDWQFLPLLRCAFHSRAPPWSIS